LLRSLYYRVDWRGFAVNILAGALVARYMGPEGPEMLHWLMGDIVNPEALKGRLELCGFLLGAGGVAVVGWFYDIVGNRLKKVTDDGSKNVN
jgi:hypothetical protein